MKVFDILWGEVSNIPCFSVKFALSISYQLIFIHVNCNDLDIMRLLHKVFFISLTVNLHDFDEISLEYLVERTFLCPSPGMLMKKDIFMPIQFFMHLASELFLVSPFGIKDHSSNSYLVGYCKSLFHLKTSKNGLEVG